MLVLATGSRCSLAAEGLVEGVGSSFMLLSFRLSSSLGESKRSFSGSLLWYSTAESLRSIFLSGSFSEVSEEILVVVFVAVVSEVTNVGK